MATSVVGLFDDQETAQSAVTDLINAGFERKEISIIAADPGGELYRSHLDATGNIASEGAATGVTSGAVVGGLLGLLIGAGLIFVPVGVLAAGPIAGLIAGGAAGAATGGIVGGLIGLGIPAEHAEVYAESVRRGGTMVTVLTDEIGASRAHTILDRDGAIDIEERANLYREEGFSVYNPDLPVMRKSNAVNPTVGSMGDATSYQGAESAFPADPIRPLIPRTTTDPKAYADNPTTLTEADEPGFQTGGHAADGTPDTRGISEKVADTLTGDRIDDKTGKRID